MVGYLTQHQLARIAQHKYSVAGSSMSEFMFQPFWCWLVKQVPLWLAPNLITLMGLLANIGTTLILAYYCPTMTEAAPWWAYLLCSIGLFAFQSLDAIDGKQARRTNSTTPLGELFDHGCDSISTIFVCAGICISLQLGYKQLYLFLFCFCGPVLFYCVHWQGYVSGTVRFNNFDVTEAQNAVMALYIITSMFGPEIWSIKIMSTHLTMQEIVPILSGVGAVIHLGIHFRSILAGGPGKNGTTVAGTSVISPAIPVVITFGFFVYIVMNTKLLINSPTFLTLGLSITFSKLTMKLIVSSMSKSPMNLMDFTMLSPVLLAINIYLGHIFNEFLLMVFCSVLAWYDIVRYCYLVVLQISDHLEIDVFKIKTKDVSAK